MDKVKIIFILGIWTAILPYLGFPYSLKNTLFSLTGLVLVYISFLLYKNIKPKKGEKQEKSFDNFSENIDFIKENEIKTPEVVESKEGTI